MLNLFDSCHHDHKPKFRFTGFAGRLGTLNTTASTTYQYHLTRLSTTLLDPETATKHCGLHLEKDAILHVCDWSPRRGDIEHAWRVSRETCTSSASLVTRFPLDPHGTRIPEKNRLVPWSKGHPHKDHRSGEEPPSTKKISVASASVRPNLAC